MSLLVKDPYLQNDIYDIRVICLLVEFLFDDVWSKYLKFLNSVNFLHKKVRRVITSISLPAYTCISPTKSTPMIKDITNKLDSMRW